MLESNRNEDVATILLTFIIVHSANYNSFMITLAAYPLIFVTGYYFQLLEEANQWHDPFNDHKPLAN